MRRFEKALVKRRLRGSRQQGGWEVNQCKLKFHFRECIRPWSNVLQVCGSHRLQDLTIRGKMITDMRGADLIVFRIN